MSTKYRLGRGSFRTYEEGIEREWLLTNGIGGLGNMSVIGAQTRMHSGYLTASFHAPADRKLLLANIHETIFMEEVGYELTCQEYLGQRKEGQKYLNCFEQDVVPSYTYQIDDFVLKKTIGMEYGENTVAIEYHLQGGQKKTKISLTPLFNYRDPGSVSEKQDLNFKCNLYESDRILELIPKNASEQHKIVFFTSEGEFFDRKTYPTSMAYPNYIMEENNVYPIDVRNGFTGVDNHYTPYEIRIEIEAFQTKTIWLVCSGMNSANEDDVNIIKQKSGANIIEDCRKRGYDTMNKPGIEDDFLKRLTWAADHFIVNRESTGLKTILAGYPWFLDWGRDTMIALHGLTLCTGRFDDCRQVLESFSKYVKNGIVPNVFPGNHQEEPQYNTIDASLWYFYIVEKYLDYTQDDSFVLHKIYPCLKDIIHAYKYGTDFMIRMDTDGLIQGGGDFDQLTWMDVRVGDWVVTPRHGKPVEINALWYNALKVMEILSRRYENDLVADEYKKLAKQVKESFRKQFWNKTAGCLFDVINEEGADDTVRPNQIWAVFLPHCMLDREQEKSVVNVVREELYTPYGIRSLSNRHPLYQEKYIGKLICRDGAYHMGTAWAFISGAFISSYCKVNNYSEKSIAAAREMCFYFQDHMEDGCLNGIAEIFDGDFASSGRGCYSQAWSVGEILRVYKEDILGYKID